MTYYDWPPEALPRIRSVVLAHAGVPRHSFGLVALDAPSLHHDRVPAHRAPKHRADRAVDGCQHWPTASGRCPDCRYRGGSHRSELAAWS